MKDTENFLRTNQVIQSDKSVMSEGCKELVLQDFQRVFEEYFDLTGMPKMSVVYDRGVYRILVSFEADRIKKFNVLK